MPASFETAAPFSADAYAAFGAGPIIDRQIDFRNQQQLAAQNHAAQAGIAQINANAQMADNYNNNEAARIRQTNQAYIDQRSQQAQFAHQSQMQADQAEAQARDRVNQLATWGNEVSYQDQQEMTRQQNGLATLQKAVDEGTMSPEEALPAMMQLRSRVDMTKQRLQTSQAEKLQQDVKLEQQRFEMNQQNLDTADKMRAQASVSNSLPHFDSSTGRMSQFLWNPRTMEYYDPAKGSKQQTQSKRFGDEGGNFSYKNALPEAKAEAEAAYPVVKEADPKTGKEVDINARDRAEYFQNVLKRLQAEHGGNKQPSTQQQPSPQTPQEQQPQQPAPIKIGGFEAEVKKLKDRGMPAAKVSYLRDMMEAMRQIAMTAQGGVLTPEKKQELQSLRDEYERLSKE